MAGTDQALGGFQPRGFNPLLSVWTTTSVAAYGGHKTAIEQQRRHRVHGDLWKSESGGGCGDSGGGDGGGGGGGGVVVVVSREPARQRRRDGNGERTAGRGGGGGGGGGALLAAGRASALHAATFKRSHETYLYSVNVADDVARTAPCSGRPREQQPERTSRRDEPRTTSTFDRKRRRAAQSATSGEHTRSPHPCLSLRVAGLASQ